MVQQYVLEGKVVEGRNVTWRTIVGLRAENDQQAEKIAKSLWGDDSSVAISPFYEAFRVTKIVTEFTL